jgi:hypothetical protein
MVAGTCGAITALNGLEWMAKYKQGQTLRRGTVEVTHKGKKKGKPKMLSPEEFDEKAEGYYASCIEKKEAPTIPGLAFHLGFSSRQSMYDYGKDGEYKECTDRAKLFIEAWLNKKVVSKEFFTPGQIFILKASFGYEDKQQIEHSEKVTDTGENEW